MPTLSEVAESRTSLGHRDVDHLHRLLGAWQLIADLSFADLLLWCALSGEEGFVCVGQMRPYTAQTVHPEDDFGKVIRPEELPVVERAFLEGRTWRSDEPLLIDGVPVRMEALPVPFEGRVIAVVTKEGAPLTHRRSGELEANYLECSSALGRMLAEGTFPLPGENVDPEVSPRVGDGLVRLSPAGRVIYASPNAVSAYRRLGIVTNIVGESIDELAVDTAPIAVALSLGVPAEGDAEAGSTVVLQRAIPFLEGPDHRITGVMVLVRDVTELRHRDRMLQQKEAVIREVHHRVKNNLQTIASLLRLQARRLGTSEARAELEEAVRRIASIAVVHETLSQDSSESVEFADVARKIIGMVSEGLTHPDRKVRITFSGEPGRLPAALATPLAVVMVELLQNAVEHAFDASGPSGGTVEVRMQRDGPKLRLEVADDGRGLPEGFSLENAGLGLQIVKALVTSELGGSIEFSSGPGTSAVLEVPLRRRAGMRP